MIKLLIVLVLPFSSTNGNVVFDFQQTDPIDSAQLRHLLNEAWALTDSAEYQQALNKYDRLVGLAYDAKLWDGYVEAMRGLGINYTRLGQEAKSLEVRKKLVADSYEYLPEDNINIGVSEKELSISYQRMGNYDSAFYHIQKALEHNLEYIGENTITTSRTINSIGFLHSRLEALDSAVKYYKWALNILLTIPDKNYYQLGIAQNNLGATYRKLGHYDLQAAYLRQALDSFKKSRGPTHPVLATIYNNLANAYKQAGDFDNQLQFTEKALEIRQKNFDEVHPYIAESYTTLAEFHLIHADELDAFFTFANDALRINRAIFPEIHEKIGAGLHLLGKGYQRLEQYEVAYQHYQESYRVYQSLWGNTHGSLATELAGMSDCLLALGNVEEATNLLNQALAIREDVFGKKHPLVSSIQKKLAQLKKHQHDYANAMEHIQAAMIALARDFNNQSFNTNPPIDDVNSKLDLLDLLIMKGSFSMDMWKDDKREELLQIALDAYVLAIDLADEMRYLLISKVSQDEITELAFPAYEGAILAAWNLYSRATDQTGLEVIWTLVERSRSFRMRLAQQKENIETFSQVPDNLTAQEKSLTKEITALQESIVRTSDSLKSQRLSDLLFSKELQFEHLTEKLRKEYPPYYNLLHNLQTVSVDDVKQQLEDDVAIVSYFSNDIQIYRLIVTNKRYLVDVIEKPNNYELLLYNFRSSLTNYHQFYQDPINARAMYTESATALYELLLKDIHVEVLRNSDLIIIPDEQLGTINFEALITVPPSAEDTYANFSYLLRSHSISYSNSYSFLARSKGMKKRSAGFGGFAPTYSSSQMQQDTVTTKMFAQLVRSGEWTLPGAKDEIESIGALMKGEVWVGEDATERTFIENANQFSIVHLAMHGLLDDEDPLSSELIFSLVLDTLYDGHLSVREIYNIELDAELVVLSACNSGFGQVRKGEGLISLSQAFQYAGCPSVMTSLWKVSDDATKQLMINTYESLIDGKAKGAALRDGKLTYIQGVEDPLHAHPYFWAGFILMGDEGPLSDNHALKSWGLALAVLVLVGFSVFLIRRRKL